MNFNLVYDLAVQPFSLGDMITHQQAALCFREREGYDAIDVTVLYTDEKYIPNDKNLSHISFERDIKWMMSTARVNRHLGTLCLARRDYYRPARTAWPDANHYTTYVCWQVITDFYNEHGWLPSIEPADDTAKWAARMVGDAVTVNLRLNPVNHARDADYGEWAQFFDRHRDQRFIVICATRERDRRFDALRNVSYAECDMEHALAMIWASNIHIGMDSGPAQMRWYGKKPFTVFRCFVDHKRVKGMTFDGKVKKMPWMTEHQNLVSGHDTVKEIDRAYHEMLEIAEAA